MALEEGDIVLCTVDRIIGTTVFVKIHGEKEIEGSIVVSEIAPGRIRNLRDYVVPKKMIVCKILKINAEGNIYLSLRRVTQKEQKEVLEEYKQEKSFINILKTILKENADAVIEKIKKEYKICEFIGEIKENPSKLENMIGKKDAEKIHEILIKQKKKNALVKKQIRLISTKPNGLEQIKEILGNLEGVEIKYISAGKYVIQAENQDIKTADNKLKDIISKIEKKIQKQNMEFSVKEK